MGNSNIVNIISGNGTETVVIDISNTGSFQLFVEETDINGCKGYDSIIVYVYDLPEPVIIASDIFFCEGDSVLLELDSLYSSVFWSDSSLENYIYVTTSGSYFATVTDTNGCSNSSESISVNSYNCLLYTSPSPRD